jgi:hypothetical protein
MGAILERRFLFLHNMATILERRLLFLDNMAAILERRLLREKPKIAAILSKKSETQNSCHIV